MAAGALGIVMVGVLLLVAALGLATAFGLWRRATDGALRPAGNGSLRPAGNGSQLVPAAGGEDQGAASQPRGLGSPRDAAPIGGVTGRGEAGMTGPPPVGAEVALGAAELGRGLGERATLVQFSSAFCAPCRATRTVLSDVAGMVPGVAHVEIDAESHLDLVRRLDVRRTPTVLVLDPTGRIRCRAVGAPRRADVIAALGEII